MKKLPLFLILTAAVAFFAVVAIYKYTSASHFPENAVGRILLQVESHGEAWYVLPTNRERYYLGRPDDAFAVMKKLGLGAKHELIAGTDVFPERLSGMILLDVEEHGEAYYIYPVDLKKYYLGRPSDAFRIMRELGLGISNENIVNVAVGDLSEPVKIMPPIVKVDLDVPFASQAPFADWEDQRQQDGCEEASALMAMRWVRGESLTKDDALREIVAISDFELDKYGEYRDISSADTIAWIFNDYFNYFNVELKQDITINDIIGELEAGNVVIAAMNGQLLNNPNFAHPGPVRHMLLIRGYDPSSKEFITNDPGTRLGEGYRYGENVLFNAIRDYPTGYHELIDSVKKNMIVVSK